MAARSTPPPGRPRCRTGRRSGPPQTAPPTPAARGSRPADKPDGTSGAFSWEPFLIDMSANSYDYQVIYSPRARPCTWRYQGDFEFQQGHWAALAPRVLSYTLGR